MRAVGAEYAHMTRRQLISERAKAHFELAERAQLAASQREVEGIIHELEVHQEEVRIQNEQLIEAQRLLEESRDRYADLYELAPIVYVTIDGNGLIEQINLTGASLLGTERARILGMPLLTFVVRKTEGSSSITWRGPADRMKPSSARCGFGRA